MTGTETSISLRRRLLYVYFHIHYWIEGVVYRLGIRKRGAPPPHAVKRRVLRQYARRYGTSVLVETGTYLGDMMAAMANAFDELHSIELSAAYYEKARARFAPKPHIHLHRGDSAVELAKVLPALRQRTLFWLDAHYSGGITARAEVDTPIVQELREIFARNAAGHVVLVDDAHCFDGTHAYPTVDGVRDLVRSLNPGYSVEVAEDIIRITPPQ